MAFSSSAQKIVLIRSLFQLPPSSEISSLTVAVLASTFGGDWTVYVVGVGSHLSSQILIFSQFLTLHLSPNISVFLAEIMLFQIKELWPFTVASRKFPFLQYFSFSIVATKVWGCVTSPHSCLANKALLKHSRSQNPMPPMNL